MNFWDNWPKPWSRDQCRDRYVRGTEISYPQLSQTSCVPQGTINRWCKGNAGKTWKQQRDEFLATERSESDRKAIERRSDSAAAIASAHKTAQAEMIDELSISLKDLGKRHFDYYDKVAGVASFMLDQYDRMVKELTSRDDDPTLHPEIAEALKRKRLEYQMNPEKFIKAINLNALGAIANIIHLCVQGQRVSTGMQYEDINNAIRLIKRAGLEVNVPKDADLIKLSIGKDRAGCTFPL